jgi:hypothetical protein
VLLPNPVVAGTSFLSQRHFLRVPIASDYLPWASQWTGQQKAWIPLAIRLISAMTPSLSGGLPGLLSDLDLRLQTLQNSSRCQRSTMPGWKMWKAFSWLGSLEGAAKYARSRQVSGGRIVCLLSTINCWRSRAFSSTNRLLLHVGRRKRRGFVRGCQALSTGEGVVPGLGRGNECLPVQLCDWPKVQRR